MTKSDQIVVFMSPIRAYSGKRVRDIQQVDGKTLGWVRHQGGDWVVRRESDQVLERWTALEFMSVCELKRSI